MSVDQGRYRAAMSQLATAVTVVATRDGDRHELMTANAVISVSLEPTLLVVSVAERARWLPAVLECGHFVVNVLGREHADLARWCADHARHDRPGHLLDHDATLSAAGLLRLTDAMASIECRVHDHHRAGGHRLVVGEVDRVDVTGTNAEPLIFFDRAFTTTSPATTSTASPRLHQVVAS